MCICIRIYNCIKICKDVAHHVHDEKKKERKKERKKKRKRLILEYIFVLRCVFVSEHIIVSKYVKM